MLASLGKAFVPVYRKVRVAVLSTGDELIELGEPPSPGTIVNSNSLAVAAAVRETGAEAVLLGIARDDLESHAEKISDGLKADALITTAGVSAGDRDLVREVLAQMGVVSRFWRVGIKPGGPTAFGTKDGVPVFSLPGNPVSALITFEAFVRPALLRMMGRKRVLRPLVKATLAAEVRKNPERSTSCGSGSRSGAANTSPLPPGTRTPESSGRWFSPTPSRFFRPTKPSSPPENEWTSSCSGKRYGEFRRVRFPRCA